MITVIIIIIILSGEEGMGENGQADARIKVL